MAIDGIGSNPNSLKMVQQTERLNLASDNPPQAAARSDAIRGDHIYISEQSREFLRVRQLVDQLPDVRIDRVNKLAEQIDNGTYQVSGDKIADAMIRKNMVDILA